MAFEHPGTHTAVDRRRSPYPVCRAPSANPMCTSGVPWVPRHTSNQANPITTQTIVELSGCELSAAELLPMIVGKSLLDHATRLDNPAAIDTLVRIRVRVSMGINLANNHGQTLTLTLTLTLVNPRPG